MNALKRLFFYLFIGCIWLSCKTRDVADEVIEHYSKSKDDSLKLKAAIFLINNLKGQLILDTTSVEQNQVYFDQIDNLWKREKMRVGFRFPTMTRVIDSLNKIDKLPQQPLNVRYVGDQTLVTSDFIIDNIEKSFYVWKNMPWAKNISFDEFCEYILPYRCTRTYSFEARDFFFNRYKNCKDSIKSANPFIASDFIVKDINKWFIEDPIFTARYPYLVPIKFSNLLKGKFGDCQDANSLRIAAFRALGIPTVMDEVPNWGNSNQPHFWYKIIDPIHDTVKTKITNINIGNKSTHSVISASSYDDTLFYEFPKNIQVQYVRSVPKVYRRTFAIQSSSLAVARKPQDEVPQYFLDSRMKDVTDHYVETADITLSVDRAKNEKFLYLCIFDNQRWVPVAWSKNSSGKATFRDMGKNIVYLPAYFKNNTILSAGDPFLLDSKGSVNFLNPSKKSQNVKLHAKFPVRTYVLANEHKMVGGRFQLANKADFSDSVTIHTVKSTPFQKTVLNVSNTNKFRYAYFQFKGISILEMCELAFYGLDHNGKEIKIKGRLIGSKGAHPYETQRLFDGNRATYFKTPKDEKLTHVGIDLGENNKKQITRIEFVPHSDDNNVVDGDLYELFYWDSRWVSLGIRKGDEFNTVSYNKVPVGALLLLKNIAGGVEERIFTYTGNRQIFW